MSSATRPTVVATHQPTQQYWPRIQKILWKRTTKLGINSIYLREISFVRYPLPNKNEPVRTRIKKYPCTKRGKTEISFTLYVPQHLAIDARLNVCVLRENRSQRRESCVEQFVEFWMSYEHFLSYWQWMFVVLRVCYSFPGMIRHSGNYSDITVSVGSDVSVSRQWYLPTEISLATDSDITAYWQKYHCLLTVISLPADSTISVPTDSGTTACWQWYLCLLTYHWLLAVILLLTYSDITAYWQW